jgi:hypothetical protein
MTCFGGQFTFFYIKRLGFICLNNRVSPFFQTVSVPLSDEDLKNQVEHALERCRHDRVPGRGVLTGLRLVPQAVTDIAVSCCYIYSLVTHVFGNYMFDSYVYIAAI